MKQLMESWSKFVNEEDESKSVISTTKAMKALEHIGGDRIYNLLMATGHQESLTGASPSSPQRDMHIRLVNLLIALNPNRDESIIEALEQERSPGVSNADAYEMISGFIQGSDDVDDKKKRELLAALRKTFTDGGKCDIALDDMFGEGYLSEDDMKQIIEAWQENIGK